MILGGSGLCAAASASANRARYESALRKYEREFEKSEKEEQLKERKVKEYLKNNFNIFSEIENYIYKNNPEESLRLCPECNKNFYHINFGSIQFDYCKKCKSHLFDISALSNLAKQTDPFTKLKYKNRISRFKCPDCQNPMTEFQYTSGINLLIDACEPCSRIYLEKGEFERAVLAGKKL